MFGRRFLDSQNVTTQRRLFQPARHFAAQNPDLRLAPSGAGPDTLAP